MEKHDLIVIGAGPGGYVAALRAAQLGLDTACVEKEPELGGTCLRIGCIPSKALLESSELYYEAVSKKGLAEHGVVAKEVGLDLATMMKRKERIVLSLTRGVAGLFRKNDVTRYQGTARFTGPHTLTVTGKDGEETIEARHVIVATGSRPATLPGLSLDGERIVSSTEALAFREVPKRLLVIGAGYIGLEMGSIWSRLGSEVTVLEYLDRILPGMDAEIAAEARKVFEKQGLRILTGRRVTGARVEKKIVRVEIEGEEPLEADRLLVAVGRVPATEGLGLDEIGVETDERGFIRVDSAWESTVEKVYAVGDVIGGAMLAHKASEEGVACVERIVTGYGHVNYGAIPGVVYTDPEIATVGKSEEELKEEGVAYRKGSFPFLANGRAKALGKTDGRVKILADEATDRVLGVHILGPRAGDLVAELVAAIEFGASSEDVARISHAHPSLAEVVKEAALAVSGRALHI